MTTNFFRGIADTTFQRNPNQFSKHKWIATNVKDPRTMEFRVFVLRSEDTSRQRAAWKDMNTKKSSTLQRRAGSSNMIRAIEVLVFKFQALCNHIIHCASAMNRAVGRAAAVACWRMGDLAMNALNDRDTCVIGESFKWHH